MHPNLNDQVMMYRNGRRIEFMYALGCPTNKKPNSAASVYVFMCVCM